MERVEHEQTSGVTTDHGHDYAKDPADFDSTVGGAAVPGLETMSELLHLPRGSADCEEEFFFLGGHDLSPVKLGSQEVSWSKSAAASKVSASALRRALSLGKWKM